METMVTEDLSINVIGLSTSLSSVRRTKTTTPAESECKVCKASARYSYYGAIVCESCKMFFKRNAENRQTTLKCRFYNECNINLNTRHICSFCRLKKCFASGMQSNMIRSSRPKKNKYSKKNSIIHSTSTSLVTFNNKNQPEQIPTLSLLRSDRSTLTADQWNLLSNLDHCFNEYVGYSFVEDYIRDQNALHPKLRFKYSSVIDYFTSIKSKLQLGLEKNQDFLSLSLHGHSALLRTTLEHTTGLGGMFISRQHKLFDYLSFYNSAEIIFGPVSTACGVRVIDLLDPDNMFIKLTVLKCQFNDECDINVTTHRACSSCRLKKCFGIGMCSKMIRPSHSKKKKKLISDSISTALVIINNQNQPEQIPTLNLLRSDQSTLNLERWNLLSNLVHCFDEYIGFSFVTQFTQNQNALPVKLRFKFPSVTEFFTSMKTKIQLLSENNRDLLLLPPHDRTSLLRTTIKHITSVGSMFVLRRHHLLD